MARDDASDRKAFNKAVNESIDSGQSPSLEFLRDGEGGNHDWKMGIRMPDGSVQTQGSAGLHTDVGSDPGWVSTERDAGHTKSAAVGENRYAIEGRAENRHDGATTEKAGQILEKPAVVVDGLPINRDTAKSWEDKGLLKPGTVENASPTSGWSKADSVSAKPVADSSARSNSQAPGKDSAAAAPFGGMSSDGSGIGESPSGSGLGGSPGASGLGASPSGSGLGASPGGSGVAGAASGSGAAGSSSASSSGTGGSSTGSASSH